MVIRSSPSMREQSKKGARGIHAELARLALKDPAEAILLSEFGRFASASCLKSSSPVGTVNPRAAPLDEAGLRRCTGFGTRSVWLASYEDRYHVVPTALR